MSIIYTGMKMPNSCRECKFSIGKGDYVYCPNIVDEDCRMKDVGRNFKSRHYGCPLRSVEDLIEHIRKWSYPVHYDRNSIEYGMTMTGIEQAIREYCEVEE